MTAWARSELEPAIARLAPYARRSFARALELAARLHAEELSPEHWLAALLEDESCAATRIVLHAFADPETIGVEVLALCAGIMVVGSERTLPFSVLGVAALNEAHDAARARSAGAVEPADLFRAAARRFPGELAARLAALKEVRLAGAARAEGGGGWPEEGGIFRHFSPASLRALAAGARFAAGYGRAAIGPVHLGLGALDQDAALREETGLNAARLRLIASGLDDDATPLPERQLGGDPRLIELLAGLPDGAGTQDVLGRLLGHGSEELTALLRRQKVTPALFERCRDAYRDPET